MDYVKSVERKPELLYGLPTDVRSEVERFRAKPELDGAKAYQLVYNFLISEGVEPEEARKVAEEIAKTIPKLPPKDRAKVVEDVVGVVKLAKQRTLDYYTRREAKAKEVVKEAVTGKPLSEMVVYGLIEEFNVELGKYPTLSDLWDRLVAMGFDVGNLKELVESLKRKGAVVEEDGKYVVKYLKEVKVEKPRVGKPKVERKPPPVVRTYEEKLPEHLRAVYRRWMELLGG
jgi:arginyl-tRNA synthetase